MTEINEKTTNIQRNMTENRSEMPRKSGESVHVCLSCYMIVTKLDFFFRGKSAPNSGAVIGYSVDGEAPDALKSKEE